MLVAAELRNMKALLEAGEIANTRGQPHGRRGMIGGMVESGAYAVRDFVMMQVCSNLGSDCPISPTTNHTRQVYESSLLARS